MVKTYFRNIFSKRTFISKQGFIDGMASVLDIGGTYRRNLERRYRVPAGKKTYLDSDAEAIRSDWKQTGLDLQDYL